MSRLVVDVHVHRDTKPYPDVEPELRNRILSVRKKLRDDPNNKELWKELERLQSEIGRDASAVISRPAQDSEIDRDKLNVKLAELRSKFQNIHYQRIDLERRARKDNDKTLWEAASLVSREEVRAREDYNQLIRWAQAEGLKGYNTIRAGETR